MEFHHAKSCVTESVASRHAFIEFLYPRSIAIVVATIVQNQCCGLWDQWFVDLAS